MSNNKAQSLAEAIDLKASDSAGPWWHNYYCSNCKAEIGHQERMTQICLTCGAKFAESIIFVRSRASRRYFKDGRWMIQHRYAGGELGYSESKGAIEVPAATIPMRFIDCLGVAAIGGVLGFVLGVTLT
jgi:hypothetical protein